jgi:hypothetical protein
MTPSPGAARPMFSTIESSIGHYGWIGLWQRGRLYGVSGVT